MVPATQEAEVGESLEPRSSSLGNIAKHYLYKKIKLVGQALWLTPVIPALWKTEEAGSHSQKFKTSLGNIVKPSLY